MTRPRRKRNKPDYTAFIFSFDRLGRSVESAQRHDEVVVRCLSSIAATVFLFRPVFITISVLKSRALVVSTKSDLFDREYEVRTESVSSMQFNVETEIEVLRGEILQNARVARILVLSTNVVVALSTTGL